VEVYEGHIVHVSIADMKVGIFTWPRIVKHP